MNPEDLKKLLSQLHGELASRLLTTVLSGEATAADLNVVRQFLKDNGIDATTEASPQLRKLATVVPFADPEAPIRKAGES